MKFTVRKQDLQQELGLTLGVVESKVTIPILSHLLVQAGRDGLDLLATDLEIGIRARCTADVTAAGSVTVPARKLHDVVRALDSDVVSFETEENHWVRIEGGSFRGRIMGLPGADFPPEPAVPAGTNTIRVPLTTLQSMISRVLFAVATENTRFSLNGALLLVKGGEVVLVATDGHRLAVVSQQLPSKGKAPEFTALVPRKALAGIARMSATDENEEIEVAAAENHAFFKTTRRTLFCRLLEGSFPAWEKVLPESNQEVVIVQRGALASMLSRVALLTSETSRLVGLAVANGSLTATTSNQNMGEAREELKVEHVGEDVSIGLNCEYLLQFLQACSSETVEIRLKNSATQALLTPKGDGPWNYRYVVMPMRLS